MAAELEFQAIVDLVGDKLREVLKSEDIGIDWHRPETRSIQNLVRVRARQRRCSIPDSDARAGEH